MPTPTDTYIENRTRIQPHQSNNFGTAHGGEVMRLMDEAGAISAMRFAGETCVTAGVEGIAFENPIAIGDIALVEAFVYAAGRTSVRVHLRVRSEDPRTMETQPTNTSSFVFVAIDGDGDPIPVPDLTVESERDRRLRERGRTADHDGS